MPSNRPGVPVIHSNYFSVIHNLQFSEMAGLHDIQLADLKMVLSWAPFTQRELVAEIKLMSTVHVDQSSLSRYLTGKSGPSLGFKEWLGKAFPKSIYGPEAEFVTSLGVKRLIPDWVKNNYVVVGHVTPDANITTDGVAPPSATTISHTGQPFPLDVAHNVCIMARKAQVNEGKNFTFSTRKLILWGQVYNLFQTRGYDDQHSLAAGYHLAVLDKQIGDDRKTLYDFFQSKFGFDADMPQPLNPAKDRHPAETFLEMCVLSGIPTWTHGPTGCGKTFSAEAIAKKLYPITEERPISYLRFQGSIDKTVDDLVGGYGAENGNTVREYGPLPLCMQLGVPFILDEPTAVPAEVMFELQAVLEGNPLVISKFRGEVVKPQPGFCIVACDNTIGQGEANEYVGTNMMNEAFRDRFLFLEYDFMPKKVEKTVVKQQIEQFAHSLFLGMPEEDRPKPTPIITVEEVVVEASTNVTDDDIFTLADELFAKMNKKGS